MARHPNPTLDTVLRLTAAWLMLLTVGCGAPASDDTPSTDAAPEAAAPPAEAAALEVREARANLLPNGMGAVYFEVVNGTAESDRLVGVETDAAENAEMHESVDEDGVMRMVPHPDGFEIAAGETLSFAPGGRHVMLIDTQVADGAASIDLILTFEQAGHLAVTAALSTPGGEMESVDHGEHEGMDHGDQEDEDPEDGDHGAEH